MNKPGRAANGAERLYHKQAFRLYMKLGPQRSYAAVASALNVSKSTVKNWAKRFGWKRRVQLWQEWEAQKYRTAAEKVRAEQAARTRKVLDAQLRQLARSIAEGRIKVSFRDSVKLERLRLALLQLRRQIEDGQRQKRAKVAIIIPDNGRGDTMHQCIVPQSLVDEYKDFLEQ